MISGENESNSVVGHNSMNNSMEQQDLPPNTVRITTDDKKKSILRIRQGFSLIFIRRILNKMKEIKFYNASVKWEVYPC